MKKKKYSRSCGIGGQAVLEGVMMKNKDMYAVAVRKPDGEIEVDTSEFRGILHDSIAKRLPFVRGIFNFLDSMILGMRTLTWSVSFFEEDDTEEEAQGKPSLFQKLFGDKAEDVAMGLTMAFSLIVAVGIFMMLPYFISDYLKGYIRNASLTAIVEGLIRILIFVMYVVLISAMKDIRRLYQYHGAEHKCINCIERGRPLTVRNVMRSSRQHRRCGTSFLLFVMFVSVILFFFIRVENPVYRIVIRILLIPVIAGISYEIIRLAGSSDNILVRILSAPGMWLQKLTTKEPDESMVEVAIASVEAVFDWRAYLKDTFGYEVEGDGAEGKGAGRRADTAVKTAKKKKRKAVPEPDEKKAGKTASEPDEKKAGKTAPEPEEKKVGKTVPGSNEKKAGKTVPGSNEKKERKTVSELNRKKAGKTAPEPEEKKAGKTVPEPEEKKAGKTVPGSNEKKERKTVSELNRKKARKTASKPEEKRAGKAASKPDEKKAGKAAPESDEKKTGKTASEPEEKRAGKTASEPDGKKQEKASEESAGGSR